jgi:hypothetical protein
MARPLRIQYAEAFYHVTSRGNERKAVFLTDRDREKFLSYLGGTHRGQVSTFDNRVRMPVLC